MLGKVEKPALQKAEMEWNIENAISSSMVYPGNVVCMSKKIISAPTASMESVKTRMYISVEKREDSDSELIRSRTIIWEYSDVFPIKNIAKKQVKVITPKPPICISTIIMESPIGVNVVATSTDVSPVTHVALVEIKRASMNDMPV